MIMIIVINSLWKVRNTFTYPWRTVPVDDNRGILIHVILLVKLPAERFPKGFPIFQGMIIGFVHQLEILTSGMTLLPALMGNAYFHLASIFLMVLKGCMNAINLQK